MGRLDHLRFSGDIRRVYASGKRFNGKLLTVFVRPNDLSGHRFGITASRKAVGNAVQRNRAKRLVREAFRSNAEALQQLRYRYDYVFNARRSLLDEKAQTVAVELRDIIARISQVEEKRFEDGQAAVK